MLALRLTTITTLPLPPASVSDPKLVDLLLKHGADPTPPDKVRCYRISRRL